MFAWKLDRKLNQRINKPERNQNGYNAFIESSDRMTTIECNRIMNHFLLRKKYGPEMKSIVTVKNHLIFALLWTTVWWQTIPNPSEKMIISPLSAPSLSICHCLPAENWRIIFNSTAATSSAWIWHSPSKISWPTLLERVWIGAVFFHPDEF